MSKIYKYVLQDGENELAIPSDSQPLSVIEQFDTVMIWILHHRDPDTTRAYIRRFYVINDGDEFNIGYAQFIGTVILYSGTVVKHIFEQLDTR